MHPHRRILGFLLSAAFIFAAAASIPRASAADTAALLQKAVSGSWRSSAHKARDRYRHPIETLEFFGIEPNMTVIELAPGDGWYTEILAPFLYSRGHLIVAATPKFEERIKSDPAVFGHVEKIVPFSPPQQVTLGRPGSADMVLTFRSAHNWLNIGPAALEAVFKEAFAVLKSRGTFGVVEHRAKPFADALESSAQLHRIPEDYLIEMGIRAGFRLSSVSEINANAADPEDINTHRMLPGLDGPESEHAQMEAIGESDRMTLRFVKP